MGKSIKHVYLRELDNSWNIRTSAHRLIGLFITCDPDIYRSVRLKEPLFTWDVASLILHILGLSILSYMDGHVKNIQKR